MLSKIKNGILESSLGYSLWSKPLNGPKIDAIHEMLQFAEKHNTSILDIGCGPGSNSANFTEWDYLGIDLNPAYIKTAQASYPNCKFMVADAGKLQLDGTKYEVILINSLMHHLTDEECIALLKSCSGCMTDDSILIAQEPLIPPAGKVVDNFFMKLDRGDHFRDLENWQMLFTQAGFEFVKEKIYPLKLVNKITAWTMYSMLLRQSRSN